MINNIESGRNYGYRRHIEIDTSWMTGRIDWHTYSTADCGQGVDGVDCGSDATFH
jgi:hypothetical protein